MKSDLLQGIIIVRGPGAATMRTPARHKKINVVSEDDFQISNSNSSANLIKILNKLRSFS